MCDSITISVRYGYFFLRITPETWRETRSVFCTKYRLLHRYRVPPSRTHIHTNAMSPSSPPRLLIRTNRYSWFCSSYCSQSPVANVGSCNTSFKGKNRIIGYYYTRTGRWFPLLADIAVFGGGACDTISKKASGSFFSSFLSFLLFYSFPFCFGRFSYRLVFYVWFFFLSVFALFYLPFFIYLAFFSYLFLSHHSFIAVFISLSSSILIISSSHPLFESPKMYDK
jgi:hypothetical protein